MVRHGARGTAIGSTMSAAMHRERPVRMMILLGLFVFASLHVAFSGAVCFAHIHNYGRGGVSCGDHRASDCSKCPCDPQGLSRGEFWCNGDCHWNRTINECKERESSPCSSFLEGMLYSASALPDCCRMQRGW